MAQDGDMWKSIKEIQSSSRLILQRFQNISTGLNACTCPCHSTDREAELENLRRKVKHLEEMEKKKDEEIIELKKSLRVLKEILGRIETPQAVQPVPNETNHGKKVNFQKCAHDDSDTQNETCIKVDRSVEDNQAYSANGFATVGEDSHPQSDDDFRKTDRSGTILNDTDKTDTGSTKQKLSDRKKFNEGVKPSNVVESGANDIVKVQSKTLNLSKGKRNIRVEERKKPHANSSSRVKDTQTEHTHERTAQGKPPKVNCLKTAAAETSEVKVIEQKEKRTINFMDWHIAAAREKMEARNNGLSELEGIYTVVCVDISHSMTQDNAWKQANTFFTDLIEGFKESLHQYHVKAESVALVTFGHKTEVLKRFTQDFASLQSCFDGVLLGGPSPMYGGLHLSIAAFESTKRLGSADVNGLTVLPRLILITDGHLTDTDLIAGPDKLTLSERDRTNASVLEIMQHMEGKVDVLCVPVGNADKEFLQFMVTVSNGKMLTHKDGRKVGTRLRKVLQAASRSEGVLPFPGHRYPTESDEEDIAEILEADEKRKVEGRSIQRLEICTERLPEIGSRVRRGLDWKYKGQDGDGPGTVIGHGSNDEQIWIEWDNNGKTNVYRYGAKGYYDVLIVDEPRLPKPNGELAVGCIVTPGKDWHQSPGNINRASRGVVVQVDKDGVIKVRWYNKERGDYVHKPGEIHEVEFCPMDKTRKPEANVSTSSHTEVRDYTTQSHGDSEYRNPVPTTQRNKNKNKNLVNKNAKKQT